MHMADFGVACNSLFILFFLCLVRKAAGLSFFFAWKNDKTHEDILQTADRIRSVNARSEFSCTTECLATSGCVAFFYNKYSGFCQLQSSVHVDSLSSTASPGSKFYVNICMKHAYKYDANLRKYYLLHDNPIPVKKNAEKLCNSLGGSLITLSDENEFRNARKILDISVVDKANKAFWVGAEKNNVTGKFTWKNGLDVKQNFWVSLSGVTSTGDCVLMMPFLASKLDTFDCVHSNLLRKIYPFCECVINCN